MLRTGLLTIAMIVALQGFCFGQGFLDSLLGPSGLGLWGGGDAASQQYNNPQMWGGAQGPQQQPYQQPGAPGQQQIDLSACRCPGLPPGLSCRIWLSTARVWPAATGSLSETGKTIRRHLLAAISSSIAASTGAFRSPAIPDPSSSSTQAPQRYTAPPVQAAPASPTQAAPRQPSLRPGQYVPGHAPVATADDLPPGAVRMTTTTPEGAWVQYYPPTDEPGAAPGCQPSARLGSLSPNPPPAKAQSAKHAQPHEQTTSGTESRMAPPIEMPKPVEIPQSLDPRYGWDTAVNRGPVAPAAR